MDWRYDDEPDQLWSFILEVHERDFGDEVARHLGAGPLEDLMSEFGNDYIESVEARARSGDHLGRCFAAYGKT